MCRHNAGIIRSVELAYALSMPLVDHDSPVPLYAQLAAELRRRIAEDGLTRLPSFVSLMQEHGVSRETAERAVHVLIDSGEAYVVPGKGTFTGRPPGE